MGFDSKVMKEGDSAAELRGKETRKRWRLVRIREEGVSLRGQGERKEVEGEEVRREGVIPWR